MAEKAELKLGSLPMPARWRFIVIYCASIFVRLRTFRINLGTRGAVFRLLQLFVARIALPTTTVEPNR